MTYHKEWSGYGRIFYDYISGETDSEYLPDKQKRSKIIRVRRIAAPCAFVSRNFKNAGGYIRTHTLSVFGMPLLPARTEAQGSRGCSRYRGRGVRPASRHRHPSRPSEAHPWFSHAPDTIFHNPGRAYRFPADGKPQSLQTVTRSSHRQSGRFHLRPDGAHLPTDSPQRGRHRSGHGQREHWSHCRQPYCSWIADGPADTNRRQYGSCRPDRRG